MGQAPSSRGCHGRVECLLEHSGAGLGCPHSGAQVGSERGHVSVEGRGSQQAVSRQSLEAGSGGAWLCPVSSWGPCVEEHGFAASQRAI